MAEYMDVPKPAGRSVSISEERNFVMPSLPDNNGYESESDVGDRKQSGTSFLLPAVNLARRLSMRISGNRDLSLVRRRKRRAVRNENKGFNNGRRKSRSSIAQMSLDMERGLIILKEETPNPIMNILHLGMRRIRILLGLQYTGVPVDAPVEPETISLQTLEPAHRYRPSGIKHLCQETGFSESELKRLYRGFKNECPTGVVDEENFHNIYTHLFPWGEESYHPYICSYSHYLFSTLDQGDRGIITFEDFVLALSLLYHGTEEEKIEWTFKLYDLNGDGLLQKDELLDVAIAVLELMGKSENSDSIPDGLVSKIGDIFEDMDVNSDGAVSLDEFTTYCKAEGIVPCLNAVISGFKI
ncbi:Kv channel-interacting protein 4 isoform X2 [Eurytemora carolleeae]|uniref:Kv channel-interacting protein 4 isoform X2 n=1 Tax=Eurytemora carolleeae TaxID=1294199 RepID=UPI000C7935EA|nr:Kv channel-interacting protein 4 isoform X2 [Eurytemora carolleeae]|eukprot:XP_023339688.1 Kv channel-interacting protein 4-like isoform X2 [Eurytemora affinis]